VSSRGKKTAVLTVRLSKELYDVLLGDAERNGITASSLVNRIVKKYVEWDRHAEKFRLVTIPAENFRFLIEHLDDKTLTESVETVTSDQLEALMLFWFKKISLHTVLETVNVLGRYGGLFEHEVEDRDGSHVITLTHGLGKKWSTYIGALISRFIKKELNAIPEIICTDDTAVITFRMGSSDSRGSAG
jgi:hypothetical protein